MFFARLRRFFRSFCLRLTIHRILLSSVILIVVFFISFWLIRRIAGAESRQHLTTALEQVKTAYLGRQHAGEISSLPEELFGKIEAQFPGIHIGFVEREDQPNGWMYEILGSVRNIRLEILAIEDGQIWISTKSSFDDGFCSNGENIRPVMAR